MGDGTFTKSSVSGRETVMQTIYVAAYPKSGSTWLTRLLADALNSPTGGSMPEQDAIDIVTEGQDRPGAYIIRRGHFTLTDNDTGPVVPEPHKLAWKMLTSEKVVFLVRDPRAICVSGAYHWQVTPEEFLEQMIAGDVAGCGRWDEYAMGWLNFINKRPYGWTPVKYMLYEGINKSTLSKTFCNLKIPYPDWQDRLTGAIKRQSIKARKAWIGDDEAELRRNNIRKGVVGDWINHFTPEMNDRIWSEFGEVMKRLGYRYE